MKKMICHYYNVIIVIFIVILLSNNMLGDPIYSPAPNGYTVTGTKVTGTGTNPASSYFFDSAPNTYTISIAAGADLGNTTFLENSNELDFYAGSVNNKGSLAASNNAINFATTGSVTNSGTIAGSHSGIAAAGSLAVVNSGSIIGNSQAAVYSDYGLGGTAANDRVSLVNRGTLSSATGDGFDAFTFNDAALLTSTVSSVITVNNSGTITAGSSGLNFDNDNDGSGGNALNSLNIKNSGSITAEFAIDVDDFFNEDSVGTGKNIITLNNSGSLTSSSEMYISAENDGCAKGINTFDFNNSGSVVSTGGEAFEIEAENNGNIGDATNTVLFTNSGSIQSVDDTVNLEAFNENGGGSGFLTIYVKNSGSITSTGNYGIDLDDDDYNFSNAGNGTAAVTIINSGSITAAEGGIYLEPYNEDDGGNGVTHVYFQNTGSISATSQEAYENGDGGNYDEAGNGTNTSVFINSGTITGGDDAADSFIYNEDNGGSGVTHDYFFNSGTITATSDEGAYFYSANSGNGGVGTNYVTGINTASGTIAAPSEAVDLEGYNSNNLGTGRNSNSLSFSNAGTVDSTGGIGVLVLGQNVDSAGDASNTIRMVNTGTILSDGEGIDAEVENANTAGNSTGSIIFFNSGTVTDIADTGVDLENTDNATTGTGSGTIKVENTSTGVISGATEGLFILNDMASPDYTARVSNAGVIEGGTTGIELATDNGVVLTTGGRISGGTDAILLDGTDSKVTILGRTTVEGVIEGSDNAGNVLNFDLAGATPAQIAAARVAIAAAAGGPGSFTVAGNTYNFDGFSDVNLEAVSFGGSVDSGLQDLAGRIDNTPLPAGYDLVYAEGFSNPEATLNSLSGREFLDAARQIGLSNATAMAGLADNRAFQLRSGSVGLDFTGLNVNPASMIASLGDTQNLLGRIGSAAVGGTTMNDSKDEKTMVPAGESPRWGAWASGTVTFADESATNQISGYNATSGSPTVGVDYRVCPNLVVGALFNYTTGDVDFNDGSKLNTDSEFGALYADWTHGHWYVDGLAGYGNTSYDQTRNALNGNQATASPNGDNVLATLNGGYDFKLCGFVVSPEVGLQYTRLTKDAFSESGAGAFNLNVGNEDVNSLRTKVGVHANHVFMLKGLKLTPDFNAAWYHECLDDTTGVRNSLPGAPGLGSFIIDTNSQGRDFALVGAGLVATPAQWQEKVSFFVNYDAQVGQNDFLAHTVDGGVRVNF